MTKIVTIRDILNDAKNLEPRAAHDLCVTPVYRAVRMEDGAVVELHEMERHRGGLSPMPDGRGLIAAGYLRVSEPEQRTARDRDEEPSGDIEPAKRPRDPRNERGDAERDGWSEAFQVESIARYCVQNRWAFRLYSDCGISGAKPYRNQALIESLTRDHARTYERCFSKVLDALHSRFSGTDIEKMRAYMERRIRKIEQDGRVDISQAAPRRGGKSEPPYRPGLTELSTLK